MSTPNSAIFANRNIKEFYHNHLHEFGNSSKGVGWKNDEAQTIRFDQLNRLILKDDFSINDLGCGTGKYFEYLQSKSFSVGEYNGYDIFEEMVTAAKQAIGRIDKVHLSSIVSPNDMKISDYTVASGIFNVKYENSHSGWTDHVIETIRVMNEKSNFGFAFNALTSYSDKEFMQEYLYYADPCFFFDFCKRNFSKNVALLHDYDQYDFTILVRKTTK